jgi:chemotaxis receptor (MCP) glutamine deamidase CheD
MLSGTSIGSSSDALRAEDLGGGSGRTVWFDPRDAGVVRVHTVKGGDRLL